jgi:hypothetical protein
MSDTVIPMCESPWISVAVPLIALPGMELWTSLVDVRS